MNKPASKKQVLMIAVIWTISAIISFLIFSRPGESSFRTVGAAVILVGFVVNAVTWWRRWMIYCKAEIKNQEEQNHE